MSSFVLRKFLYISCWTFHTLLGMILLTTMLLYCLFTWKSPIWNARLESRERARIRREKEQPIPLLSLNSRHRRSISHSFDPAINMQSLLFSLPPEIRIQIYSVMLGDSIVHLGSTTVFRGSRYKINGHKIVTRNRLTHARCMRVGDLYCRCFRWYNEPSHFSSNDPPRWGYHSNYECPARIGVAILQTCRQVYAEAVPLLYSTNIFMVHNLWDLIDFSQAILPESLALVTQLEVKWLYYDNFEISSFRRRPAMKPFPLDDQTWIEFWDVISSCMPGLRHLKASLDVRIYSDHSSVKQWIDPFLKVHGLTSCQLELRDREAGEWGRSVGPWQRSQEVLCLEERLQDHMCDRTTFVFEDW